MQNPEIFPAAPNRTPYTRLFAHMLEMGLAVGSGKRPWQSLRDFSSSDLA
jgi:hypothetical protein